MVQKSAAKRGRPRAYDPEAALARALDVFWGAGYAATSLDELSAATRMNRPSLYSAFGDKRALYLAALERYRAMARDGMAEALSPDRPLRDGLRRVYEIALATYLPKEGGARGCFMIATAVTEAAAAPEVREALAAGLREIDGAFEARLRQARDAGELPASSDPAMLARLASATLYFLAIRSRAGETRAMLKATAESAIDLMCGPAIQDPGGPNSTGAAKPRGRR